MRLSSQIVVIISLVILIVYFLYYKERPTPIYSPPVEYAIIISENNVIAHTKYWLSDDDYIADSSIKLNKNNDYVLQAFWKPQFPDSDSTFNSESKHQINFTITDIKPGKHKIFYKSLYENYFLGEFTWPVSETKYIFSKEPHQKAKQEYKDLHMLNNTIYELTDEDFFQQYWIDRRFPDPRLSKETQPPKKKGN